MANLEPNPASEILSQFADIEKRLGELFVLFKAQELALCDLLPDFEANLASSLESEKCWQLKLEAEHRMRVLLEARRKISGQ
jgi:hypothetical protein